MSIVSFSIVLLLLILHHDKKNNNIKKHKKFDIKLLQIFIISNKVIFNDKWCDHSKTFKHMACTI